MKLRVVLADDEAMVRAGFRMILETEADIEVVGEAEDGQAAVALTRRQQPDVVIMDIRMPRLDGVEATRQLLADPAPPSIVIVTTFDDDEALFAALRAGASGFLLKNASPEQLVEAVRTAASGEGLLATSVTRRVIAELGRSMPTQPASPDRLAVLTTREREVLRLLGRGLSNAEIADTLTISHATAKTHVARIMTKLHLTHRAKAVVVAYETGLIEPGHP